MPNADTHVVTCATCGQIIPGDALICPKCGGFVHRLRLEHFAGEATRLEQTNPQQAAQIWQQCLPLLPPNSPQYQNIQQRIAYLLQVQGQPAGAAHTALHPQMPRNRPVPRNDPLPLALAKTIGSMIISAGIYAIFFRHEFFPGPWAPSIYFSIGFVVLMLVHEMGHVFALRYYGMRASPPIFWPFIGAVINLRQSPSNALAEAVVGIGGPLLGTVGAIACFVIALVFPQHSLLMLIAYFGFILNLFNLLPVPPLDGGRISAALSPRLWVLGLAMLVLLFGYDLYHGVFDWLLVLVLVIAWPRIRRTLSLRHAELPYYQVSRRGSLAIGILYAALAIVLVGLMIIVHRLTGISLI